MAWIRSHKKSGITPTPSREPSILGFYSKNTNTVGTLTHTFSESGTYQYIVLRRLGDGGTNVDPVISLNSITLVPSTDFSITSDYFYYGEVTVSANDVLTVENTATVANSALQCCVLSSVDISLFSIIGFEGNNSRTFLLPNDTWILQVYYCGYYSGNNNYSYRIEKHFVTSASNSVNNQLSIPTPNDRSYWYGFTYAITI